MTIPKGGRASSLSPLSRSSAPFCDRCSVALAQFLAGHAWTVWKALFGTSYEDYNSRVQWCVLFSAVAIHKTNGTALPFRETRLDSPSLRPTGLRDELEMFKAARMWRYHAETRFSRYQILLRTALAPVGYQRHSQSIMLVTQD